MQKYILISDNGFYAYMFCKVCKDVTEHEIHFFSYLAKEHKVLFFRFCSICRSKLKEGETLYVPQEHCSVEEWEILLDIDPNAENCMDN